MGRILFLLFIILIVFLTEPFIGLPLLFLVSIAVSSISGPKTAVFTAFICGLLTDIADGRKMGATILYFLVTSLILMIYKRRMKQESLLFQFISSFIFVYIYFIIFAQRGFIFPLQSFISSVIVIVLTVVLYSIRPRS